ncbi:hypothetical protein E8D34_02345 [Nocardioides sp. GY 10113]|uniref:DAPG hydrolase family protein n=1 Tax=Nocardioides sp. GY 10113 TaxID=2569761 RepID=UPI0010A811DB|nr:hypothetical protein [Nocardioides sp. GY 10113]TIC88548.1 hypothetical protein E8D34_02345 [Nocardioides sp. GY 10113]
MISRRSMLSAAAGTASLAALPLRPAAAGVAGTLGCAPRYLGYRRADRAQPYASYMASSTRPIQAAAARAVDAGPTPASAIPPLSDLTRDLAPTGYSRLERGYGLTAGGQVWVAMHTRLPGNTAAMWDWWFGWHSTEPARYKLWHPDAHAFAAIKQDRSRIPGLTDRQKYVGNTSYVDEYIGDQLEQLAISFVDPERHGFVVPAGHTVVTGHVGSSVLPVRLGRLAHQIRPTGYGAEMRSRFYLNVASLGEVDARANLCAIARNPLPTLSTPLPFDVAFGRDLMQHCAAEMNHLSRILPDLYAEFRGTP